MDWLAHSMRFLPRSASSMLFTSQFKVVVGIGLLFCSQFSVMAAKFAGARERYGRPKFRNYLPTPTGSGWRCLIPLARLAALSVASQVKSGALRPKGP